MTTSPITQQEGGLKILEHHTSMVATIRVARTFYFDKSLSNKGLCFSPLFRKESLMRGKIYFENNLKCRFIDIFEREFLVDPMSSIPLNPECDNEQSCDAEVVEKGFVRVTNFCGNFRGSGDDSRFRQSQFYEFNLG